jgi:hypothetical protein
MRSDGAMLRGTRKALTIVFRSRVLFAICADTFVVLWESTAGFRPAKTTALMLPIRVFHEM